MLATSPMGTFHGPQEKLQPNCLGRSEGTAQLQRSLCHSWPEQEFSFATTKSGVGNFTYIVGAAGMLCMDFAEYSEHAAVELAPCVPGKASQQFGARSYASQLLVAQQPYARTNALMAVNPAAPWDTDPATTLCVSKTAKPSAHAVVLARCNSSSPAQGFYPYFILPDTGTGDGK